MTRTAEALRGERDAAAFLAQEGGRAADAEDAGKVVVVGGSAEAEAMVRTARREAALYKREAREARDAAARERARVAEGRARERQLVEDAVCPV